MPFNVLTDIAWKAAFWTEDPSWTPPADGAVVASWRDAGSEAKDATATAGFQPTYRASTSLFNGRPTVQFAGSQHLTTTDWTAAIATATTETMVVVASGRPNSTNQHMIGSNTLGGSAHYLGIRSDNSWQMFRGGGGGLGGVADNNPHLVIGKMNGSAGTGTIQVDGVTVGNIAGSGSATLPGVSIGSYATTFGLIGHIAFAAVFEGTLTAGDLQNLRQWANGLYGINFTDFAVDPGLDWFAPAGPAVLGRNPSMRRAPVPRVSGGQNHSYSYKNPTQAATVGTFTQTSDYPLYAIESDTAVSSAKLVHTLPYQVTIAPGELCLLWIVAQGAWTLAQNFTISDTAGLTWVPGGDVTDTSADTVVGSSSDNSVVTAWGGTAVYGYKNITGAPITTWITVTLSQSVSNNSSGIPSRRLSQGGFILPVTITGAVWPCTRGTGVLQNGNPGNQSYGLNWQSLGTYKAIKAGCWIWGLMVSKNAGAFVPPTGTNSDPVYAYNPTDNGGSASNYGWALYRTTATTLGASALTGLPAGAYGTNHHIYLELQPEVGFDDNDIRNVRPQVVPGQFVREITGQADTDDQATTRVVPASITGQKHIQPQGFHHTRWNVGRIADTHSTPEGLALSPFTPKDSTVFPGRATTGPGGGRVMDVNSFLIGPGEVALLFMQIECLASSNIQTYTQSTITSVVEITGQNPAPVTSLVWDLVRNSAGTRAFRGHSTGSSQNGGFLCIYFAYNPPENGWVVSKPRVTVNTDPIAGTAAPLGHTYAAEMIPVVFRNAYPYLAGGSFALTNYQGSNAVSAANGFTPVGGSSWIWAASGSKDTGTGVNSSATNCEFHFAGVSTSGQYINRRGFDVLRSTKLNGPAGSVNPAITFSAWNNNGGDGVWIEIRQAESATPKRLVYPGFGTPGGAPGGRLEPFIPGEEVQNALNIYSKQGGVQVQAIGLKVKSGGSWVDATAVWYRDAGVWVVV